MFVPSLSHEPCARLVTGPSVVPQGSSEHLLGGREEGAGNLEYGSLGGRLVVSVRFPQGVNHSARVIVGRRRAGVCVCVCECSSECWCVFVFNGCARLRSAALAILKTRSRWTLPPGPVCLLVEDAPMVGACLYELLARACRATLRVRPPSRLPDARLSAGQVSGPVLLAVPSAFRLGGAGAYLSGSAAGLLLRLCRR